MTTTPERPSRSVEDRAEDLTRRRANQAAIVAGTGAGTTFPAMTWFVTTMQHYMPDAPVEQWYFIGSIGAGLMGILYGRLARLYE